MGKRNFTIILKKNKTRTRVDQKHAKKEHSGSTTIPVYTIKQGIQQIADSLKKGDTIGTIWVMTEQRETDGYIWNNNMFMNPENIKKEVWQNPDYKEDVRTLRKHVETTSRIVFETCYGNKKTQEIVAGVFGISNVEYTTEYTWMRMKDAKLFVREKKGRFEGYRYVDIHSKGVTKNKKLWKKIEVTPQPLKRPAPEPQWKPKKKVPIITPGGSRPRGSLVQPTTQFTIAQFTPGQSGQSGQSGQQIQMGALQARLTRETQQKMAGQAQRQRMQQIQQPFPITRRGGYGTGTGIGVGTGSGAGGPHFGGKKQPIIGTSGIGTGTGFEGESLIEKARKRQQQEEMQRRRSALDAARDHGGFQPQPNIRTTYMPKPQPQPLGKYATSCLKIWQGPIGGPYDLIHHSHDRVWVPAGTNLKKTQWGKLL